jgi:hypothetical protein
MQVGDTITVTVKNPMWPYKQVYASYVHIPEFNEYTGRLCESGKRDPAGTFRMTRGSSYPVRLLDIDRVVDIVVHEI